MKRKHYSEEQIINILKEHEAGLSAEDVIRKHGIAHSTFHRWKSKFGGMEVSDAKRLRDLEAENNRLKKLLAETMLEKTAVEGCLAAKVVKPTQRRELVGFFQAQHHLSQRRACRLAGLSRKAMRYVPVDRGDKALSNALKKLGEQYPRYGYLMLHALLRREGHVLNKKRTYRLYTELGMQVRTKRRKKLVRPRVPIDLPMRPNERWSLDFVSDQLSDGRRIRVLNIVDDYSRVCVGQLVDTSISGQRMANHLDVVGLERDLPASIVMDNGPEMTSKAMFFWSQERGVKLSFIQPGKPTQNAYCESFNGKFRDNCLNQHWFRDLKEARQIIEEWRNHYNLERPHSSLGYTPPTVFEKQVA